MEKELNIAAILKKKVVGTKLWSPIVGECTYNNYYPSTEEIVVNFTDRYGEEDELNFQQSGRTLSAQDTAEVCLFPSKPMRDWSKFAWKKGDVLVYIDGEEPYYAIFEEFQDDEYAAFKSRYNYRGGNHWLQFNSQSSTNYFAKASDDEAKEFIKKIEEHYEGKLNLSTLEIQKQPEFKDGDIVRVDEEILIILKRDEYFYTYYHFFYRKNGTTAFNGSFTKSGRNYRLATNTEKQQLFDALAKEGKVWNSETKQFKDLPKKCELKPFEKVLVRDTDDDIWMPTLFGFHNKFGNYVCLYDAYEQCIPYNDETKHLLGTTDEWKGGEG